VILFYTFLAEVVIFYEKAPATFKLAIIRKKYRNEALKFRDVRQK
jgi:hypothetical protein